MCFFYLTLSDLFKGHQKLDIILENNEFNKLEVLKNVNCETNSPKQLFFNEKN